MSVGPDEYKEALSKLPAGVTIVTAADGDEMRGMTATSFASVSLHPPLVLVCLEKSSRTRELVLEVRRFAVSILARGQEGISRAFATRDERKPFDTLSHHAGETGAPLIDGARAWIECEVVDVIDAGDHDVVIADVIATEIGGGEPLVYYARDYRSLEL